MLRPGALAHIKDIRDNPNRTRRALLARAGKRQPAWHHHARQDGTGGRAWTGPQDQCPLCHPKRKEQRREQHQLLRRLPNHRGR